MRDCYASYEANTFTIGNRHVERQFRTESGLLYPTVFTDKNTGRQWLSAEPKLPAPTPPEGPVEADAHVGFRCERGKASPTQRPSLTAMLSFMGAGCEVRYYFRIFAGCSGITMWCETKHDCLGRGPATTPERMPYTHTDGIENEPVAAGGPSGDGDSVQWEVLERLELNGHLRLVQVELMDQTDSHNELVFEKEWLLHPNEKAFTLSGNIFVIEDVVSREGLVFVKQAPLPHSRPVTAGYDLKVAGNGEVVFRGQGYEYALLTYSNGSFGLTSALHNYQRQYREYVPGRDGMFLSNTWGDRSRDSKINEEFMLKEIAAAQNLGVDVIQIDDGWQLGRTSNSSMPGGVWEGFWSADSDFWMPNPRRFPNGLKPLTDEAGKRGCKFGLWFAPDSSDDFANWEKDADAVLGLHRRFGIDYFKIDGVKARTKAAEKNLEKFFRRVLETTAGKIVFDLDVTAEVRPGYLGMPEVGPLFVENRYTDWHRYWPHHTLRNLWKLSKYIDPLRLRMEFLNNSRNAGLYEGDPLAPSRYSPAYLFASVMFANPLGWFEVSNLPSGFAEEVSPLAGIWKRHRESIFGGQILPVGGAPDGTSWTGFVSLAHDSAGAPSFYLLLFRELNSQRESWVSLPFINFNRNYSIDMLYGDGQLDIAKGGVKAFIPSPLSFLFALLKTETAPQ